MYDVIGITSDGYGAGKDSIANVLVFDFGYTLFGFSECLKQHLYRTLAHEAFSTEQLWLAYCEEHKHDTLGQEGFWTRKLLQGYGQFYRFINQDYWVKEWETQARGLVGAEHIVAPSVRFPNEADRIKELGGKIIRVVRPGIEADLDPSEQSMKDYPVDYTIHNDGNLLDLRQKVRDMCQELWTMTPLVQETLVGS